MTNPVTQFLMTAGVINAQNRSHQSNLSAIAAEGHARRTEATLDTAINSVMTLRAQLEEKDKEIAQCDRIIGNQKETIGMADEIIAKLKEKLAVSNEQLEKIFKESSANKQGWDKAEAKAWDTHEKALHLNDVAQGFRDTTRTLISAMSTLAEQHQQNPELQELANAWTYENYLKAADEEIRKLSAITKQRLEQHLNNGGKKILQD